MRGRAAHLIASSIGPKGGMASSVHDDGTRSDITVAWEDAGRRLATRSSPAAQAPVPQHARCRSIDGRANGGAKAAACAHEESAPKARRVRRAPTPAVLLPAVAAVALVCRHATVAEATAIRREWCFALGSGCHIPADAAAATKASSGWEIVRIATTDGLELLTARGRADSQALARAGALNRRQHVAPRLPTHPHTRRRAAARASRHRTELFRPSAPPPHAFPRGVYHVSK